MSGVRVQNPFMASLIQTRSRGWPLKGLGVASPDYQVGAHFKALDEGVLMAVLKSFEHFFAISKPAAALCRAFLELHMVSNRLNGKSEKEKGVEIRLLILSRFLGSNGSEPYAPLLWLR